MEPQPRSTTVTTSAVDPLLPLLDLPGVLDAAAQAREAVDRLLRHRVLRRESAPVSAESALRGARASAELEGAGYQLEAVRAGQIDDAVLQGALRLSGELGRHVETWRVAPSQVLARLHVLAARDLTTPEALGRPGGDPAGAQRLAGLANLLVQPRDPRMPAVVVAAVVHGELATAKPFGTADGLVARGAARLTLIGLGLDPKSVSVPEIGHVDDQREYAAALAAYATGDPEGVARWIRHCAASVAAGAVEGLAICQAVARG